MDYIIINRKETGKRIEEHRKEMHLTREKLAELLAVETGRSTTSVSVWKWETGRCDISEDYARALCQIFGCQLYELVVVSLSYYDDERDQLVPFMAHYPDFCQRLIDIITTCYKDFYKTESCSIENFDIQIEKKLYIAYEELTLYPKYAAIAKITTSYTLPMRN